MLLVVTVRLPIVDDRPERLLAQRTFSLNLAPLEKTAIAKLMTTRIRIALLAALPETDGTLGRWRAAATFPSIIPSGISGAGIVQLLRRRRTVQHVKQRSRRRSRRGQQNLRRRRTVYHLHFFHCQFSNLSQFFPSSQNSDEKISSTLFSHTTSFLLRH